MTDCKVFFFFLIIYTVVISIVNILVMRMESTNTATSVHKIVLPTEIKNQNEVLEAEVNASVVNITEIKRKIALINKEERIFNEEKFGPLQNDSLVITVQVHSRILYLKHLISSLRAAQGISNVLLIFSHDVFDEKINNLIRSIDFCKVMQIFYPYSIQIYPHEFPGNDSNDCFSDKSPKNVNKSNRNVDDENKTCRNPGQAQVKHHWWWKANKIFDLTALRTFEMTVLFLEEDFYLVKDFIPVLKLMKSTAKNSCKSCKILSLAVYTAAIEVIITPDFANTVTMSNRFISTIGLAFTRATWLDIIRCKDYFCVYNEHNWDFSLKNVFTRCMQNVMSMTINGPRVFHFGTCGMHFKFDNCDPSKKLLEISREISKYMSAFYPKDLNLIYEQVSQKHVAGPYGGWSDTRDHNLCLQMVKNDVQNLSFLNT